MHDLFSLHKYFTPRYHSKTVWEIFNEWEIKKWKLFVPTYQNKSYIIPYMYGIMYFENLDYTLGEK